MKRLGLLTTFAFTVTLMGVEGPAVAQEKKPTLSPAFSASPEVMKKFQDSRRRLAQKKRVHSNPEWTAVDAKGQLEARGTLAAYDDGVFLVSSEITPEARNALISSGVREVKDAKRVQHNTIMGNRYFRTFQAASSVSERDLASAGTMVDRAVVLTVQKTKAGRHLVVGFRTDM